MISSVLMTEIGINSLKNIITGINGVEISTLGADNELGSIHFLRLSAALFA